MRYLQKTQKAKKIKIDAKDRKILSILSSNARIPLTRLSKKVALSRDAVSYRIKTMRKKALFKVTGQWLTSQSSNIPHIICFSD